MTSSAEPVKKGDRMPIIEWKESYALGIQEFDEHHKHLVGLLNRTFEQCISGTSSKNLETVLDELIDYATYHFAAEEYWMREHKYPKLVEHRAEHSRFTARVVEIQKDYLSRKGHLSLEVLAFMKAWLTDHILKTDADYGRFNGARSDQRH